MNTYNREEWLNTAGTMLQGMVLDQHIEESMHQTPFYVSVGNCSVAKSLGECWTRSRSEDGVNHIFITPSLNDSMRILDILLHELIHAADDCQSRHRGFFRKTALAVGLQGKMTATFVEEDSELFNQLTTICKALGDIPHAKLDTSRVKKEGTRQIKVACTSCDFLFRTSRKQIDTVLENNGDITCPNCKGSMFVS